MPATSFLSLSTSPLSGQGSALLLYPVPVGGYPAEGFKCLVSFDSDGLQGADHHLMIGDHQLVLGIIAEIITSMDESINCGGDHCGLCSVWTTVPRLQRLQGSSLGAALGPGDISGSFIKPHIW